MSSVNVTSRMDENVNVLILGKEQNRNEFRSELG